MNLKNYSLLIFILFITSILAIEPDINPKYSCTDEGTIGLGATCMYYDKNTRSYEVNTCTNGLICLEDYDEFDRFSDFDPKENIVCKLPNEGKPYKFFCSENYECATRECEMHQCTGKGLNETCSIQNECGADLYCSTLHPEEESVCTPLKKLYSKCDPEYKSNDCEFGSLCHTFSNGTSACTSVFSLKNGEIVEDFRLCSSGMAFYPEYHNQSLTCGKRRNTYKDDKECDYEYDFGGFIEKTKYPIIPSIISDIKDEPRYDCEIDSDDLFFLKYKENYKIALKNVKDKPGISRFEVDPEVKEKFYTRLSYPRLETAPPCLVNFFFYLPKTVEDSKIYKLFKDVVNTADTACAIFDKYSRLVTGKPVGRGLQCLKQVADAAKGFIRYVFDFDISHYIPNITNYKDEGNITEIKSQVIEGLKAPGMNCTSNEECGSNKCFETKEAGVLQCKGLKENEKCYYQSACGVELYCNSTEDGTEGVCLKVKKENELCDPEYEGHDCEIGTYCHNYVCTALFSIPDGEKVEDFRLCKNAHAFPSEEEKNLLLPQKGFYCGEKTKSELLNGKCLYEITLGNRIMYISERRVLHSFTNDNIIGCSPTTKNSTYQKALTQYKKELKKQKNEKRTATIRFDVSDETRKNFFRRLDYPRFEGLTDQEYAFFLGSIGEYVNTNQFVKPAILILFLLSLFII